MRVQCKVNLGSRDADRIGVDFRQFQAGAEVEVTDSIGRVLVSSGIAVEMPTQVRGVSDAPSIAEETKSTIKAAPLAARTKNVSHKDS